MRRNLFKNRCLILSHFHILMVTLVFVFVSVYPQDSLARTEKAEEPWNCKTAPVFIKMGEYHFKLPGGEYISVYPIDDIPSFSNCWHSNSENPIKAKKIKFHFLLDSLEYETFNYRVTLFQPKEGYNRATDMLEDIKKRDISFSDLPVHDGFHLHQRENSIVKTYYKKLDSGEHDYMILNSCFSRLEGFYSCIAAYKIKSDLMVVAGPNVSLPLSAQNNIREAVLDEIEKLIYIPDDEK